MSARDNDAVPLKAASQEIETIALDMARAVHEEGFGPVFARLITELPEVATTPLEDRLQAVGTVVAYAVSRCWLAPVVLMREGTGETAPDVRATSAGLRAIGGLS